jgi:retron-type reverse transcriptase
LHYCSHLDRCVYQRYAFLVNQKYNQRVNTDSLNDVAIAYRDNLNKNNIDFAKEAFDTIKKKARCLVMVGDFTEFFDRLDHVYLKTMLCDLLGVERLPEDYYAVFKNITRFASWDWKLLVEQSGHKITERGVRKKLNKQEVLITKEQFQQYKHNSIVQHKLNRGIPQGSPISAILSNVYMLHFDKVVNEYVLENNGTYMRYSDDFLIILPCESDEKAVEYENWILSYVHNLNGLVELQKDKTKVLLYDAGRVMS